MQDCLMDSKSGRQKNNRTTSQGTFVHAFSNSLFLISDYFSLFVVKRTQGKDISKIIQIQAT